MTELWIYEQNGQKTILTLGGLMAEQKGIKETQEMILALLKITQILAVQFKDGLQASDALEIIKKCMTEELKTLVVEAYNGMDQIGEELKDISLSEALDLIKVISPEVMEIVKSVAKQA